MMMNTSLTRPSAVKSLRGPTLPQRVRRVSVAARAAAGSETGFDRNWLNKQPIVPVISFFAWTVPTNLGVPQLGGNSLFGEFLGRIGANLANFPQGPPLQDKFWVYFAIYHVGLFATLLLGQIGVNGRKQGYWS